MIKLKSERYFQRTGQELRAIPIVPKGDIKSLCRVLIERCRKHWHGAVSVRRTENHTV